MHITSKILSITVMLALALGVFSAAPAAPSIPWQSKVDPWVLNTAAEGETEFLVYLNEQADLSGAAALKTKLEKGSFVYKKLTEVANRTQGGIIAALQARGVAYQPYYIANMIWVRGGSEVIQALAERSDVAHLYANPKVKADMPSVDPAAAPETPEAIEWNITWVNADEVWAAGYTGQGAVVGGQDTGYDWDHPALKDQYRGWNGSQADHNYNWHDSIHSGGGVCGPNSNQPCDDHSHGTHTMGTMVGDDGASNQIGMAPGARWIGCRNMDQGVGTPTTYAECYQWFIAPTDLTNQNPDPSKAPDVINNSWGCPPSEGCTDPNVLLTVVNNVRAAGILTAHSAGNSGSACSTVAEPAAIYAASFTVGATGDHTDNIAGYSSRGPVTIDASNHMKPNISAPGSNIRSSVPGGGYQGGWSGTSMAGPHVAGLVALLISANPNLAGQVDAMEEVIEQTAVHRNSAACDPPGTTYPNNVYGWGRIDAFGAYQQVLSAFDLIKTASSAEVFPGETLTYTLALTNLSAINTTTSVVLTDTLPVGTTFVNATQPYTFDGTTVRWDFATLDPSETVIVDLVVVVDTSARGTVVNDNYAARSADIPTTFGAPQTTNIISADMLLSKTAPPVVVPGGVLTYTLTVTNPYSTIPIHNVVLTDVLPTNTTFITATLPHTLLAGALRWDFPSLAPAQIQSIELVVQAPLSGTVSNQGYSASASEADPTSGQPVNTDVVPYSLALDKTAPAAVASGGVLSYTLTVNNPHPVATTHNLVLTDVLPVNTAFITATQPVSITGDLITWNLPNLAPQGTWSVQLAVRVPLTFTGTVVNGSYGVRSDEVPMVAGLPVSTQILGLNLNKQASVNAVIIGDLITYTLTVTNQHPLSTTHNLVLSDTLPANTAYVTSDGQLDQDTQTITWTTGSLDPGESWTVHLTVQVLPDAAGPIVNFDYRVTSDETPEPIYGPKVETPLMSFIFMPVVLNSHSD